ncbi:MAG: hypothetical protein JWO58_3251 [Chitinophagaceae bacterium]|nr:hypothetical protein [Chitinophagaceae bacterium]
MDLKVGDLTTKATEGETTKGTKFCSKELFPIQGINLSFIPSNPQIPPLWMANIWLPGAK